MKIFICVIVTVIFSRANSWKCPTHCFCYSWRNMKRTDCVGKNLYNTFVGFSQETQVLDLTRNAISILHGNEFLDTNLKLLKHLILSENRLRSIDKLSFNGLEYLEYLDLSYNGIEYISPVTFQFNPNLNTLNVSNNPLTVKKDEPFLTVAPSLQVLNMAQSDLKFLTFQMFTDLKKLRVLDLSNNKIQKVDVEALETITDLKFLDISKNNIPCDDESFKVYHWLLERRIPFQPFCQNQKLMTEISEEKIPHLEGPTSRISSDSKITNIIYSEKNGMNENVKRFFKSIPSIHAMILGVQIGMLIGAFLTYFCMRRMSRLPPLFKSRRNRNTERSRLSEMSYRFDNNDMTSSLVPLNTPPGTPPSPYHSRLTLPSDFSLTKTERV